MARSANFRTELASVAGLSQAHFCKLFRMSMGRTIPQYVLGRRVDAACRLMDRDGLSLAAVGAQVGFLNPCDFSAAFRRRMGLTPRQDRNSRNQRNVNSDGKPDLIATDGAQNVVVFLNNSR